MLHDSVSRYYIIQSQDRHTYMTIIMSAPTYVPES